MYHIGQYPAHYLLFIDEVSKDDRTYTCLWGRAPVGQHVEQHDPFVRKQQFLMIAALTLDEGIIAARVLEGSFTHDTFFEYLRDDVVSNLRLCSDIHESHSALASPDNTLSWPKKHDIAR